MGHACFITTSTIAGALFSSRSVSGPYKQNLTQASHGLGEANAIMINIVQMWKLLSEGPSHLPGRSQGWNLRGSDAKPES